MEKQIKLYKEMLINYWMMRSRKNDILKNFPNMEITISNFFNTHYQKMPLSDEQYKKDQDYVYSIAQL